MSVLSLEQTVGELKGRVDGLETELRHLREAVQTANGKLDTLIVTMATAKGGWRMLLLVGTAVAATAGAVVALASLWRSVSGK